MVLHLALVVGFPLPETPRTPPSESDATVADHDHPLPDESHAAYPCQHHHCGCRSAEQCWRSCCCFSDAQKLAWARAHGVAPPAFFVVAARVAVPEVVSRRRACCQESASCDSGEDALAGGSASPERPPTPGLTWVLGLHAQGCRGLASWWLVSGATLAPPPIVNYSSDPAIATSCVPALSRYVLGAERPPVPPPRVA